MDLGAAELKSNDYQFLRSSHFQLSLFDFLSQVGKALILPFLPIILGGDCTTTGDSTYAACQRSNKEMSIVNTSFTSLGMMQACVCIKMVQRIETHDVNVTKQVNRRDRGALM